MTETAMKEIQNPGVGDSQEDDGDPDYRVTVYQYGARRFPVEEGGTRTAYPTLSTTTVEQLLLAHRMRNTLVEVELKHEESVREAWETVPELAEINDWITETSALIDQFYQEAKKRAQETRSKVITSPELKDARARLKIYKLKQKEAKARALAEVMPLLADLRIKRQAEIKRVRQEYAGLGLYWGTYNLVLEHHKTSANNIVKRRTAGQSAAHRFHRWTGEGSFAVQLQRGTGDPARLPETLASGQGQWRNVFQIYPWVDPEEWDLLPKKTRRTIGRMGMAQIRVSGKETIAIPIVLSRMLPKEADVTGVQVTQRYVADRPEITVSVTARVPKTVVPEGERSTRVALHLGWRARPDNSIRVGTWVASERMEVPAHVEPYVTSNRAGTAGEILFPEQWRQNFAYVDSIRSDRDRGFEDIKAKLCLFLDSGKTLVARPELTSAEVKRWKSVRHLVAVAYEIRKARWITYPEGVKPGPDLHLSEIEGLIIPFESDDPDVRRIGTDIVEWYRWDKKLWQREAGYRKRLIRRRSDTYKKIAAWLTRVADTVVVDNMELAELARSTKRGEKVDPQTANANANRFLVSPGDLRRLVEIAGPNHGAKVIKGAPVAIRTTHYDCGNSAVVSDEDYIKSPIVTCVACGAQFDQDVNMGYLLLASLEGDTS